MLTIMGTSRNTVNVNYQPDKSLNKFTQQTMPQQARTIS